MEDELFDDQPPQPPTETQPPAPAPPQPPEDGGRLDRVEQAVATLNETVRSAVQQIPQLVQAQRPEQNPDDFLSELAADPKGVIQRVAQESAQAATDQTLTPAIMQVLDTAGQQLMNGYQLKVDSEFGVGTFEEVFKPQLEKDMSQLKQSNPRALADPQVMGALVDRLYGGENFAKLTERRATLEKAHARGIGNIVPTGGVPRLKAITGDELPNDVEAFLRDVEKSTGETVDRKEYAKLYYTGQDSGPGRHRTSVVEYLKAVGADPDTLKMYGGERQG
jgi:hypothetical protein